MTEGLHLSPRHREKIKALLRKHLPGVEVWAYGSRVNGRSHDGSDLDLVLRGPKLAEIDTSRIANFIEALQDSTIPFLVEARDWARLPESFHREIEREHVVLVEIEERDVVGKWRDATLDQLGSIVTGKTPKSSHSEYFGGNTPFVTPRDYDGRRKIETTERHLTEKGVNSVSNACVPQNAVMVSCIGSDMGKVALAPRGVVTNQQINSIVIEPGTDPLFVYYNLSNRKAELRAAAGGSAQPILNKSDFGRFDISLPPHPEQRAIAHILGTLDDKIELNRRMNATLEALARALFKSWFVNFDPVRAKMAGRDPGRPQHLAALFPDSFVDSELGPIPEGWEVRSLDSIATFLNGLALQKYPVNGGSSLPVIKIAQLRAGHTLGADLASSDLPPQYVVHDGDVLFSWSGSLELDTWTGGDGALNQHLFKVASAEYPKWLYYHWVREKLPGFREIAADKVTTMGHIQRHHLSEAATVIPDAAMLEAMNRYMQPLLERGLSLRVESRTLAALRDALLPKLVSGELRVNVLEAALGRGDRSVSVAAQEA